MDAASWYTSPAAARFVDTRPQPVYLAASVIINAQPLEKLSAGETFEQLLQAHPRLTREGIQAALNFAREALRADVVYPIESVG